MRRALRRSLRSEHPHTRILGWAARTASDKEAGMQGKQDKQGCGHICQVIFMVSLRVLADPRSPVSLPLRFPNCVHGCFGLLRYIHPIKIHMFFPDGRSTASSLRRACRSSGILCLREIKHMKRPYCGAYLDRRIPATSVSDQQIFSLCALHGPWRAVGACWGMCGSRYVLFPAPCGSVTLIVPT